MVEWRGRGRRGGSVGEKATRGVDAPALPSLPSILPCTLTSTLPVSSLLSQHHRAVGARLAARAAEAGIQEVSWVRKSGQQFHGRARAVLEGLRGGGVGLV